MTFAEAWARAGRAVERAAARMPNPEYDAYLRSARWAARRAPVLLRAGGRCERCAAQAPLDVHHLTYDRVFREPPEDLEALCRACHELADDERRARR